MKLNSRGFIFTFDLILIVGLFVTLFSAPMNDLKKPSFDISYIQSDVAVSYYLDKPAKTVDSESYLCYKVQKNKISSVEEKEFCYSGYYESK
jgi:hypothetical protein